MPRLKELLLAAQCIAPHLLPIHMHTCTGAGGGNFPNVNRSVLEGLGELKYEIHNSANEVVFTKWYGSATQNFSMKVSYKICIAELLDDYFVFTCMKCYGVTCEKWAGSLH